MALANDSRGRGNSRGGRGQSRGRINRYEQSNFPPSDLMCNIHHLQFYQRDPNALSILKTYPTHTLPVRPMPQPRGQKTKNSEWKKNAQSQNNLKQTNLKNDENKIPQNNVPEKKKDNSDDIQLQSSLEQLSITASDKCTVQEGQSLSKQLGVDKRVVSIEWKCLLETIDLSSCSRTHPGMFEELFQVIHKHNAFQKHPRVN